MSGKKSILIVEDEPIVALNLRQSVEQWGYRAHVVNNALSAVSAARERRPALILMDVRLKGEPDGIAAATAICGEVRRPVIFLSAYADEAMRGRMDGCGCFAGFLAKPFDERDLKALIERAI